MHLSVGLIFVLGLVLAAEFVNGWTDAPNSIATVVSTRVMPPSMALAMATVFNIVGAMSGTAVAATIGKGIVQPGAIDLITVGAAMVAIVAWSTFTYYWGGLPTSESHALIAGLTGAALATAGPSSLVLTGWEKIGMGLLFSTFLGFGGGLAIMTAIYWIFAKSSPALVRRFFTKAQILSAAFMAFGHGSNDGQKFIGAFCLVLFLGGVHPSFHVPMWVVLLCAVVMGVGTSIGGWKIMKTMGLKLTKLEPVHGFAAETGAGLTIALASHFGIPLSTTHTINTTIMGVGATKRFSAVRWGVTRDIVTAWVLTFPVCGFLGFAVAKIARLFF